MLRTQVLPAIIRRRRDGARTLRILSAGCCTGEEPYTLAILLTRAFPELRDWQVSILGTDVNDAYLRKAERGIYGEWSFRSAPSWLRDTCFASLPDGRLEVLPEFRHRVAFVQLNLARDWPPVVDGQRANGFDLIVCRNVLMYFTRHQHRLALDRLRRVLVPGGYLMLGMCEASLRPPPGFRLLNFDGTTVLQHAAIDLPAPSPELAPADTPYPIPRDIAAGRLTGDADRSDPTVTPEPATASRPPDVPDERQHPQHQHQPSTEPVPVGERVRDLVNRGLLPEARQCLDQVLHDRKLDPQLHFLRATLLIESGATTEAIEALRRALYLQPDFIMAHITLATLARRAGLPEQAQRDLQCAARLLRQLHPDDIVLEADGLNAARLLEMIETLCRAPTPTS